MQGYEVGYMEDEELEPLRTEEGEIIMTVPKSFKIDSRERIQWYAKKLMVFKTERDYIKDTAKELLAKIERQEERFREFFDEQVQEFLLEQMQKSKTKSIDTLYGRVGITEHKAMLKMKDIGAVIEYCKFHHPEFVDSEEVKHVEYSLNTAGLDYFGAMVTNTETGEQTPARLITGMEFAPARLSIRHTAVSRKVSAYDEAEPESIGFE